jgi:hypothetical protein
VYDLGDNWAHEVVVEKIDRPIPPFFHPEHEDLLAWADGRFDPEAFQAAVALNPNAATR